jgi:G3E family GTPase
MLNNIPTHLIAGPLGAGKTSLLRQLLAQKPADERWALLINEFGAIGLDAALLDTGADGVSLAEVAGGCLCCVNGAPFQIGLARLLRRSKPTRLFIEPSGLGHPAELRRQLSVPPWRGVLALQPDVLVLDAAALAAGHELPDSQREALADAGLVLLNKAETLDQASRQQLAQHWPGKTLYWTEHGYLPLDALPETPIDIDGPVDNLPEETARPLGSLWSAPDVPICQRQAGPEGWSIGWRWHLSQRFDTQRVSDWLGGLGWRRAKLVLHSQEGWQSANALDGAPLQWQPSAWRRDSRIELIFTHAQDAAALQHALDACRLAD